MTRQRLKTGNFSTDQLNQLVARIERLEEEKAGTVQDIKEVYAEAKGNGFDTKTIRRIVMLRRLDAQEREESDTLLCTYMKALGMQMTLDFKQPEGGNDVGNKPITH